MAHIEDVQSWIGAEAVDPNDESLGKVEEILLDGEGEAALASIKSGLITKHRLVPLDGAAFSRGHVRVAYPKDLVRSAPVSSKDGVSRRDAAVLGRHYGIDGSWSGDGDPDELWFEGSSAAIERRRAAEAQLDRAADLERQAQTRVGESEEHADAASDSAADANRLHAEAETLRADAERDLGH
jgi:hypothetical protein